ncbi:MAG TPA: hypothetical protein PLE45_10285 [Spirochaetota bacterium]|nr:hypothetical protein [Spirochaetota bacterium]HOL57604.1 hypothetical protein [Spirochaetota bacterium]HPP05101.1 hypothetical protein [Spirochaetota bacterium]
MEKIRDFLKKSFYNAFSFYKEERLDEAKEIILETKDLWFNHRDRYKFMTLLSLIYIKLNELNIAERILLEALSLVPGNLRILDLLGNIYLKKNRYKEAEKIYKKAKKEDSYNFDITLKLAYISMCLNDYDKMINILKEGYRFDFIGENEEKKLKSFLVDFLKRINYENSFYIIKDFRKWWIREKKIKNKRINSFKF